MEESHKYGRENINTAMVMQKRYHDQKLSWQKFKSDEKASNDITDNKSYIKIFDWLRKTRENNANPNSVANIRY